jgi:hypothetical protein
MTISTALFFYLACLFAAASGFTSPISQAGLRYEKGVILGPVARNGIEWDEIVMGQGRRILPGDTVLCYYTGSYTINDGAGFFSKDKTVVFDKTSTHSAPVANVIESIPFLNLCLAAPQL